MRALIFVLFIFFSLQSTASINKEDYKYTKVITGTSISAISSALARADIALTKSMINPNHLKGEYGEAVTGKIYLDQSLKRSGNWKPVNARFGRQGIDQIYIKYDKLGRPRSMIVAEVKYGSSRLGMTKDGIQVGERWTQKRLIALGNRYLNAASARGILVQKRPSILTPRHQIDVVLKNGKKGVFWRNNAKDSWKYEGSKEDLIPAQKKVKSDGNFIKKSGENVISVRRKIVEVTANNNEIFLTLKNAQDLNAGKTQARIKGELIRIPLKGEFGDLSKKLLSEEVAKQIKNKLPHLTDMDSRKFANNIVNKKSNIESYQASKNSFRNTTLRHSLNAGSLGGILFPVIEGVSQIVNGDFDPDRLIESSILGFGTVSAGTTIGQLTTSNLIRSRVAYDSLIKTASTLGLSTPFLANTAGVAAGAGTTAILYAYAGYFLGYYDIDTANILAASSAIGVGGSTLAVTGTMTLVTSFATAGTGTAISSLSGVTASNAALAWLGGGTIASGGTGMAGGAIVLGGVVTVTAVAFTAVVLYTFQYIDEINENKMYKSLLVEYKKGDIFKLQAQRLYPSG